MNSILAYFLGLLTLIAVFIAFYSLSKYNSGIKEYYNKILCN